jgi:hypothetical protein
MAMARAQELQEWDSEMENGHGGYGILQMHSVHFKQPMFYILEWVLAVYHIL